jgi:glutathione S-transferase
MTNNLTVYGHPASQPSRTVFWACLMHNLPFTLGDPNGLALDSGGTNPRGQVPSIVDDDFRLAEMGAIVAYLSDKHGWRGFYPPDLKTRARIDQFMHMHHSLVRLATWKLMAPHVVKPLGLFNPEQGNPLSIQQREMLTISFAPDDPLQAGGEAVRIIVGFLEEHYFNDETPYICNTETCTAADIASYAEIGQFQFANLFDFSDFPRTRRWLEAMKRAPAHDAVHAYNLALGDIAAKPNTMENFQAASEAGFDALVETGLATRA